MEKTLLETPELVVDLDKLDNNIQRVADIARKSGVKLRPHVKTHKTPAIAHKQLDAGAQGVTVAKLGEAEVMAAAGIKDIFVAYEIVGEKKIERLLDLHQDTNVVVAIDSLDGAVPISKALQQAGMSLDIRIEIDTGLGRCGVAPMKPALELAQQLQKLPGLNLKGIFTHEGHTMSASSSEEIKQVTREVGRMMVETAELLRGNDIDIKVVSVGSTPAVMAGEIVDGITEIRPGTYVFYDASGVIMDIVDEDECAATVLATVISRPAPDRAIIDSGSKVLTVSRREGGMTDRLAGYGLVKGERGVVIERLNEEHGYVVLSGFSRNLKVGDKVEIIPYHICPVINLFDQMVGVRGNHVEATWPILARGKSK